MNSWVAQLDSTLRAAIPNLPASENNEKAMKSLQKSISKLMPAPFRDFMLWKPAGLQISFEWDMAHTIDGFLLEPGEMETVKDEWKQPSPKGTQNWWNGQWVPVLGARGDFLVIDLVGAYGNPAGSLVNFYHDKHIRHATFPNFEGWVRWLATALQQQMGRAFLEEEGKLEIILSRKAARLHKEMFANYPIKNYAEVVGLGMLDRVLNQVRNHGLEVTCELPGDLKQEDIYDNLTRSLVREDSSDTKSVRVILLHNSQTLYANLTLGEKKAVLDCLVSLPENAADAIRSAKAFQERGEKETASRRLSEAAFTSFQAGKAAEAVVLLRRALQLHPENSVASRSLEALEAKKVEVDPALVRPLLLHIY